MTELKPCPFCGSENVQMYRKPTYLTPIVWCKNCNLRVEGANTVGEKYLLKLWNSRAIGE